MDWTDQDQMKAGREGWDLFDAYGSDHGDLQLQKFDFPEEHPGAPVPYPFDSDVDAWVFVRTRAEEGSELHRKALALLAQENPDEHHRVMHA